MVVKPAYGMYPFGEVKIKMPQQAHIVRAYELGNHIVWLVDDKVAIGRRVRHLDCSK